MHPKTLDDLVAECYARMNEGDTELRAIEDVVRQAVTMNLYKELALRALDRGEELKAKLIDALQGNRLLENHAPPPSQAIPQSYEQMAPWPRESTTEMPSFMRRVKAA